MKIDQIQLATILAALRFWQGHVEDFGPPAAQEAIATGGGEFTALDEYEIDILCEELNCSNLELAVVREPHLAFLRSLACLPKDGEETDEDEEFAWENDDAWEKLHELISDARILLEEFPGQIAPPTE